MLLSGGESTAPETIETEEVGSVEETPETESYESVEESDETNTEEVVDASSPEERIKSFQSQATKAQQEAADFKAQIEELQGSATNAQELQRQVQGLKSYAARVLRDDGYRSSQQQQFGIQQPNPQAKPEGWDQPEAVQARNLLMQEFVQGIEQTYGIRLADLPKAMQQAASIDSMVIRDSQSEINTTKESIEKEGMPWTTEILNSCIAVVGNEAAQGKEISLRQAYDRVIMPVIEKYKAKEASTDERLKVGTKPMKPGNKGGRQRLTGDALLKQTIDGLADEYGVGGSYDDG